MWKRSWRSPGRAGAGRTAQSQTGQLLLRALDEAEGPSVELLALDTGPGMAHVGQCLQDGYSTDGLTLARAITAAPTLAAIRLILLSSWGQHGDARAAQAAGIAAYLTKPVRHGQLYQTIMTVLHPTAVGTRPPLITRHRMAEAQAAGHLRVLVGAFEESNEAHQVLEAVRERFSEAYIAPRDGPAGKYYRVRVGPFATEEEAKQVAKALQREGHHIFLDELPAHAVPPQAPNPKPEKGSAEKQQAKKR